MASLFQILGDFKAVKDTLSGSVRNTASKEAEVTSGQTKL
jgi:hypothetical protein